MLTHKDKQDGSWYNTLCCMCIFSYQPELLRTNDSKVVVEDELLKLLCLRWELWITMKLYYLDELPPVSFNPIDVSVLLSRMQSKSCWMKRTLETKTDGCCLLMTVMERLCGLPVLVSDGATSGCMSDKSKWALSRSYELRKNAVSHMESVLESFPTQIKPCLAQATAKWEQTTTCIIRNSTIGNI